MRKIETRKLHWKLPDERFPIAGRDRENDGAPIAQSQQAAVPFEPEQSAYGDVSEFAREMLKTKRRIIRLYAEHCRRSFEEVEHTLDRDHFMTPEEALEWGLIDRILKQREDVR